MHYEHRREVMMGGEQVRHSILFFTDEADGPLFHADIQTANTDREQAINAWLERAVERVNEEIAV